MRSIFSQHAILMSRQFQGRSVPVTHLKVKSYILFLKNMKQVVLLWSQYNRNNKFFDVVLGSSYLKSKSMRHGLEMKLYISPTKIFFVSTAGFIVNKCQNQKYFIDPQGVIGNFSLKEALS